MPKPQVHSLVMRDGGQKDDASKAVSATHTYAPFGTLMSQSGSHSQPFKFSTKLYDEQTGLSYFGYRFYAPALGRWMKRDPIGYAGGLNLYAYLRNNPLNQIELWGLSEEGAMVVYGETSGLYPQLLPDARGGVYRRENWESGSFIDLQIARMYIADVSERNKKVNSATALCGNSIEQMVWEDSLEAAAGADYMDLPEGVNDFYIRQGDELATPGAQPKWALGKQPYETFGPFINIGGGDVPKGNSTYIDFYQGVR